MRPHGIPSAGVLLGDARRLREYFGSLRPQPRTVITSPPYLDLQDYRVAGQIGFGQSQEEYLNDLRDVFQACAEITTEDATMWLVVGAVRRNAELVQLPALLAQCAHAAGWIQREQVTWEKGKSLPWTKHGELRDVTEQALLLSKTKCFRFDLDQLLSSEPSSVWWRRYPERYSPAGRRPTNLWSIPIPTQGSWRDGPNHACPFPQELTYRMLALVTAAGDAVLDPFAGVGSVPAMANAMGRAGYGLEICERYVAAYPATLRTAQHWLKKRHADNRQDRERRAEFSRVIIQLRLLKYARLVASHLRKRGNSVVWLRVRRRPTTPSEPFKIVVADFDIVVEDGEPDPQIVDAATAAATKRPLSKFGIQPHFRISRASDAVRSGYWYRGGKFWLTPTRTPPGGDGPHVVASFWPNADGLGEQH